MNTLFYNPTIRGLLSLWLLFICLALVWALMRLWQQKRYILLPVVGALFIGCDIYWQYLNAYSYYVPALDNPPNYLIDNAPIWLIALINAILSVAVTALSIHIGKWQKRHISAVSIKESFDTLPTGVCFYEEDGRVYLVNNAMDAAAQALAGRHLFNGERLWNIIKEKSAQPPQENKAILEIGDKTYSFIRHANTIHAQPLYEIIAADITEQAEHNRRLEAKKAELERLNALLEVYNQNLAEIVREREILQSKAKIHDDMNVLLISTLNSAQTDDEAILKLWKSNILEMEKDTEPYRKNPLETLENLAALLGITLEFTGTCPADNETVCLLIAAVSECMTNAVRHAGASTVFVQSDAEGARITNDGQPPAAEIKKGGGLSNICRHAAGLHAQVNIESSPQFQLTIIYSKEVTQ
ncbi:MAG: hypothetical protein IJJ41_05580 [Clostridia bacterium]|nr:hypothetical protein [Clostridia bacterium]